MNRTEEGLFIGAALIVLTLAVLYGVQTLFVRAARAEATLSPVTASPFPTRPVPAPPEATESAVTQATTGPAAPLGREETAPAPAASTQKPATPQATSPAKPASPTGAATQTGTPAVQKPSATAPTPSTPPVTQAPPKPTPATTPLDRGRELTRWLYTERLDDLWATFSPTVRAEWGSLDAFRAYRTGGRRTYGSETRVLNEEVVRGGELTYYTRTATFERGERSRWTVIFGLDDRGQVQEFGIVGADLLPGGAE